MRFLVGGRSQELSEDRIESLSEDNLPLACCLSATVESLRDREICINSFVALSSDSASGQTDLDTQRSPLLNPQRFPLLPLSFRALNQLRLRIILHDSA